MDDAAHLTEMRCSEMLLDVTGTEKHQRLRHRVKKHVQRRTERTEFAAEPERRHHDARVINARISQDAAKVALRENEGRGDQDGRDAEACEQLTGKLVAKAFH